MIVHTALSFIWIHQRGGLSTMGCSGALVLAVGALSDDDESRRPRTEPTDDEREPRPLTDDGRRLSTLPPSLLSSAPMHAASTAGSGPASGSGTGGGAGDAIGASEAGNSWRPSAGNSVRISSSAMQRKPPVLPAESGATGIHEWL